MKNSRILCVVASAVMSCLPVQAATLIGKTVKVEFYSPNLNWIDSSFVHTAGVSDDMLLFDILVSRFTEGSFVLDALSAINFLSAEFNGFRIFDSNNELNAFTSVTLSGLSTHPYIATFDPERITFDADNIYINLQGTGIRGGRNLIFDIETAAGVVASEIPAAVPEPATWAMMLAGFGLIGSAMRSRVPAGGCAAHSATMA